MSAIPFFKKFFPPSFSLKIFRGGPIRTVGIDIGVHSTKVVQLRYEKERAILETYGELRNDKYLKNIDVPGSGFLRYSDADVTALLDEIFQEAGITTANAVFSIPATSSFIIAVTLPRLEKKELATAIPYEARKYIPIPISEVLLEWELLENGNQSGSIEALLIVVPKEVITKFSRIAEATGITLQALEVETASLVRSLVIHDTTPTALINIGHQTTTLAIVDKSILRRSHQFGRGGQELTRALENGLAVNHERAEALKRDVGISDRVEQREISSIMLPLLETLFADMERVISMYNRGAERKIQKIILTGGGSQLKGIVDRAASHFGVEVIRGNPFTRVNAPAFLQPLLREIGPSFSVAVGLALREASSR